jgi:integrase/recombinase XerD
LVAKLIDSARNLFHYAMLLTMYSAGLRRSELCKLKVSNIDSGRMVIRIERGKARGRRSAREGARLAETE